MASAIDDTIPVAETTIEAEPIRANFEAAKSEIEDLQDALSYIVTADRTYYVSPSGSDSNDGLSAGAPFLSIQKAVGVVCSLFWSIHQPTIHLADGTYSESVIVYPHFGALPIRIQGNSTTPANVVISSTGTCVLVGANARAQIRDLKTTTSGSYQIVSSSGGYAEVQNVNFGSGGQQLRAEDSGVVLVTGNYAISGGGTAHWATTVLGLIRCQSRTITISGSPSFSSAFSSAIRVSSQIVDGNTFSGSATGTRYLADSNAMLFTNSGGATYLPGNASGSTSNGGLYL